MNLTPAEVQALRGLLVQWRTHAEACDRIQNRRMAELQKAADQTRVSALEKVLASLDNAGVCVRR